MANWLHYPTNFRPYPTTRATHSPHSTFHIPHCLAIYASAPSTLLVRSISGDRDAMHFPAVSRIVI